MTIQGVEIPDWIDVINSEFSGMRAWQLVSIHPVTGKRRGFFLPENAHPKALRYWIAALERGRARDDAQVAMQRATT